MLTALPQSARITEWNTAHPIGTAVDYRRTPDAPPFHTTVASAAIVERGGVATCWVEGIVGAVPIASLVDAPEPAPFGTAPLFDIGDAIGVWFDRKRRIGTVMESGGGHGDSYIRVRFVDRSGTTIIRTLPLQSGTAAMDSRARAFAFRASRLELARIEANA